MFAKTMYITETFITCIDSDHLFMGITLLYEDRQDMSSEKWKNNAPKCDIVPTIIPTSQRDSSHCASVTQLCQIVLGI